MQCAMLCKCRPLFAFISFIIIFCRCSSLSFIPFRIIILLLVNLDWPSFSYAIIINTTISLSLSGFLLLLSFEWNYLSPYYPGCYRCFINVVKWHFIYCNEHHSLTHNNHRSINKRQLSVIEHNLWFINYVGGHRLTIEK